MPNLVIKGHTFVVPELFREGHKATQGEADIINRAVAKAVREALAEGRITSRSEAVQFALGDDVFSYEAVREISLEGLEDLE